MSDKINLELFTEIIEALDEDNLYLNKCCDLHLFLFEELNGEGSLLSLFSSLFTNWEEVENFIAWWVYEARCGRSLENTTYHGIEYNTIEEIYNQLCTIGEYKEEQISVEDYTRYVERIIADDKAEDLYDEIGFTLYGRLKCNGVVRKLLAIITNDTDEWLDWWYFETDCGIRSDMHVYREDTGELIKTNTIKDIYNLVYNIKEE